MFMYIYIYIRVNPSCVSLRRWCACDGNRKKP